MPPTIPHDCCQRRFGNVTVEVSARAFFPLLCASSLLSYCTASRVACVSLRFAFPRRVDPRVAPAAAVHCSSHPPMATDPSSSRCHAFGIATAGESSLTPSRCSARPTQPATNAFDQHAWPPLRRPAAMPPGSRKQRHATSSITDSDDPMRARDSDPGLRLSSVSEIAASAWPAARVDCAGGWPRLRLAPADSLQLG